MKQIFISYSRNDSEQALKIYERLANDKTAFEPWIDIYNLLPGIRWRPAIRKAIRDSDYFLAVLSNNSVRKPDS